MVKNLIKKWGISVVSIVVGAIIIFALLMFFNINTVKTVEQSIHTTMDEMTHSAVISLNHDFDSFISLLEKEAKLFSLLENPSDELIMSTLIDFASQDTFKNTAIILYDGTVYSSYNGIGRVKKGDKMPNLLKNGTTISQPRIFKDGSLVIDISTPVFIDTKNSGKIVISIDSEQIAQMFSNNLLQGNAFLSLITEDGTVISNISKKEVSFKPNSNIFEFYDSEDINFLSGSPQEISDHFAASKTGWLKYTRFGESMCVFYEPFGINNWYMAITATDSSLNEQAANIKRLALFLTLGIIFVVLIASIIVIIQRVKEQERIAVLKNTYSIAIKKTNDLFYEADIDNDVFIDHSENSDKKIWKESPKNYSNALVQVANICAPECRQQFLDTFLPQNIKIKMKEGISSINFEYKITPDENTVRWLSATFVPVPDGSNHSTKLICMENDITEQKLKQESLKRSATMDGLTGLYNHITTKQYIDTYLTGEGKDQIHALAIMDIDFFKLINDTLGHAKGDEVLSEFGHGLKKIFRKSDIVGRIGGDEFVVLLKDYGVLELIHAKMKQVESLARKDHCLLDDPSKVVKTSTSIGIALYHKDGVTFDELYKKADLALYVSKSRGRDQYAFYDATMENEFTANPT